MQKYYTPTDYWFAYSIDFLTIIWNVSNYLPICAKNVVSLQSRKSLIHNVKDMKNTDVQVIDNQSKQSMFLLDTSKSSVFERDFSVIMTMEPLKKHIVFDVPFQSEEHRLMLVTSGEAKHTFNFRQFHIKKGDLVLMPQNYIMSIDSISSDFDAKTLSFKFVSAEYAGLIGFNIVHLALDEKQQQVVLSFIRLIAQIAELSNTTTNVIEHLVVSLLYFIKKIKVAQDGNGETIMMNSAEVLTNNFLQILTELGAPNRHVAYYAQRLNVSENHLQTTIKKQTNLTVMQWVNNKTIAYIKMYLGDKGNNYTLNQIAEMVNLGEDTSLIRFFKKETNITPTEYRARFSNG